MNVKPSFSVAAFALLALSLFGFMMEQLRGKIPPGKQNRLRYEKSAFLAQASRSMVDWRVFDRSTFAEARRTGKPIMLLIGVPHGKAARDGDALVFSDREVVSFLNRYMICVRIDGLADPRWVGAYLPLTRARIPFLSGFQILFLTPEGKLFDNAGELGTTMPISPPSVMQALFNARDRLREIRDGGPFAPVPGADQAEDRDALIEPMMPGPVQYRTLEAEIAKNAQPQWGGFPRFGRVSPLANVLRYLLLTGRKQDLRLLLDGMLGSPVVDWLDGGFYRSITSSQPVITEFDKASMANAEMMSLLARASVQLDSPMYRSAALATFDWLCGEAVRHGLVAGCRTGDEARLNRSGEQSFSPRELREVLSESEREFAREHLGLRVENNPVMSVWIRRPDSTLSMPETRRVLDKLRASRSGAFRHAGLRQLDIHGYVVARLLETARVLGETDRLQKAAALFDRIEWFAVGDDVRHSLDLGAPDEAYLGDYLAYADAHLQHFLAFGRPLRLEAGLRVLQRAQFLFASQSVGVWRLVLQTDDPLLPPLIDVPEVLDFFRESCTAQAIRLCNAYGRLLRSPDRSLGASLCQTAATTANQLSARSGELGLLGASYFCSALALEDDAHVIGVGPKAFQIVLAYHKRVPTRLAAPAIGPVRPDLQNRKPGLYIVKRTGVEGPFNIEEAVRQLPADLRPR